LIDESEALFKEIEDMKAKKAELETQLEMNVSKKQMTVCEVCGAMQSATDTDKRLTTHLEGKQHMGYAKVRNCLAELKEKFNEYRAKKEREGRRERTPSPGARRRKRDYEENEDFDPSKLIRNYSSARAGTGANMPEDSTITIAKYASSILELNKGSIGVPVEAPDFEAIRQEKERRRIAWEKEHGYVNGQPPPGSRGGFNRRGRGGVGFGGRGRGGGRGGRDNYDDRRRDRNGGYDRDRNGGYDRDRSGGYNRDQRRRY